MGDTRRRAITRRWKISSRLHRIHVKILRSLRLRGRHTLQESQTVDAPIETPDLVSFRAEIQQMQALDARIASLRSLVEHMAQISNQVFAALELEKKGLL